MFAPSEPTRFGSAMKIHKCIFAALTSLTFHVEQFSIMKCEYNKKGLAPFHFLKISVDKFLINVEMM
jgi:hypothetical protein